MAITITAAAVLSMFASLTLVPMLSGLFLNQAEAQQMLQGSSDRNWFEKRSRGHRQLFDVAEQAKDFYWQR